MEGFGDWSASAFSDNAPVQFADGRYFRGGAGKERFVGAIDGVAGEPGFFDRIAEFGGELDDRIAGDSAQDGGEFGGINLSFADDKQIFPGAFGGESVHIQKQGFLAAAADGFGVRHNGIDVVSAGFGEAHGRIDVVAGKGGGFNADSVFDSVFAEVSSPRPGGDGDVDGVVGCGESECVCAVEGERADIAGVVFIFADDGGLGFADLFLRERDFHFHDMGGLKEPPGVVLESEDGGSAVGVVAPDAFKNAHAVVEGMGQHMDFGVPPRRHFAVKPDNAVALGYGSIGHGGIIPEFVGHAQTVRRFFGNLCGGVRFGGGRRAESPN